MNAHAEADARVIAVAREIVSKPVTQWGWSDVGDVLVRYLTGEQTEAETIDDLRTMYGDDEGEPADD